MTQKKFGHFSSQFLDTAGDGSGAVEMAVDGSIVPVDYCIQAGPDERLVMINLITHYTDTGSMDSGGFGNGTALVNGFSFVLVPAGQAPIALDLRIPVKTNADWAAYGQNIKHMEFGQGAEIMNIQFDFSHLAPHLVLQPGDCFGYRVNDDLTHLDTMNVLAQFSRVSIPRR